MITREPADNSSARADTTAVSPPIAFLFTGHGSQAVNMGRPLYETSPVYRAAIDACDRLLRAELERPLTAVLYPDAVTELETSLLRDGMTYSQPALFAVEYALLQLWRSWGVEPAAVLGHSVGEYAAACAAGVFDLADGLRLVAARGRLMDGLPQTGQMVACFADEAQVQAAIAPVADRVAIAVINGPTNVVISGDDAGVAAALAALKAQRIRTRLLVVAQASHSPIVDPMLDAFEAVAAAVRYAPPRLAYVSCVTGALAEAELLTQPAYWRRHQRGTVRFQDGMQALLQAGYRRFVEIGPDATLLGIIRRLKLPEVADAAWLPSLKADQDAWQTLQESRAALSVGG